MLTFAALQAEVGEWSRRNFPDSTPRDPYEGVIEEIGELAHARLKGRQGIRGDSAKHIEGEKDALADMIIFACNYSDRMSESLEDQILKDIGGFGLDTPDDLSISTLQEHIRHADTWDTPDDAFDAILSAISDIKGFDDPMGNVILPILAYASLRGFDLETIVAETWAQVRQRNWQANPATGQAASPPQAVKVMDFALGQIVTLPTIPNGVVR